MTLRNIRITTAVAVLIAADILNGPSARAATIQQQLQRHIPQVIDYLNEHNLKNVGVLKFRVKKPGQKTSDSVESLNSLLADRLEVGLILANPFPRERQLNIFKDVNAQLAGVRGATQLTEQGRAAFFNGRYKIAWRNQSAKADAFLTGVVQVHDDSQHATIGILCFNRSGGDLERVCDVFEAELDATSLGELGESFVLRGAFDGGTAKLTFEKDQENKQQTAVKEAARVKTQLAHFPHVDSAAPVKLEVRYDGRLVNVQMRDGHAFIPDPETGQRVEMTVIRSSVASGRIGVVLKVNGENTLHRQTARDIDCSKWILSPKLTRVVVRGYQTNNNQTEQFKALSSEESAKRAMDYGRQVGQIQLTVFKELSGAKPQPVLLDEDEVDLMAMLRGVHPPKQPKNLSALKNQIRQAGKADPRHSHRAWRQGRKQSASGQF